MKTDEIAKLVTYIEENLRASPAAGLPFVDTRHLTSRLRSKQNHAVLGRRGAGKTTLVRSIEAAPQQIDIYLNLEDYKDITFPNIVIHILAEVFAKLVPAIRSNARVWFLRPRVWALLRELSKTSTILRKYLHEPDTEMQQVETTDGYEEGLEVNAKKFSVGGGAKTKRSRASKVSRSLPKDKLNYLRIQLTAYKNLLARTSAFCGAKPIFLVMDDLYFVPKNSQPELIDYFHRMTKGTQLFIKLATITHRSKLYRRSADKYIGVELGHDIFEVDMDYTLDNFQELRSFMLQLLQNAIEQSESQLKVDDMFQGEGFSQLCLASGGVPRDFLSLFVSLANGSAASGDLIGKMQVNEAAIGNLGSKMESMRRDSGEEDTVLEACLQRIKRYVYEEKRTNAFLIAKEDFEADVRFRQAIRELVDLRLMHLVDHNTSKARSDGRRYEAYILDVSLYDNPRPRSFTQIEPGQQDDRARKDALRASPVFAMQKLTEPLPDIPVQLELILTDE